MTNDSVESAPMPAIDKAWWILAAAPVVFSMGSVLIVAFGYLWSQFFDTPGHQMAAMILIPASVMVSVFSILILAAFRKEQRCKRLATVGVCLSLMTSLVLLLLTVAAMSESHRRLQAEEKVKRERLLEGKPYAPAGESD